MANSGVESLRIVIDWRSARARQGQVHARASLDRLVAHRRRPTTSRSSSTSRPARSGPRRRPRGPRSSGARRRRTRATYADAHDARSSGATGRRGSFWTQNPGVPKTPDPPVAGLERAHRARGSGRRKPFARELRQAPARRLQGHPPRRPRRQRRHRRARRPRHGPAVADGRRPLPGRAPRARSTSLRSTRSPTTPARRTNAVRRTARGRAGASGPSCAATTTSRRRIVAHRGHLAGRRRAVSPSAALNGLETDRPRPGRPAPRRLPRPRAEAPASARRSAQLFWYTWASDCITGPQPSTQSYAVLRPHAPARSRRLHAAAVRRPRCGQRRGALARAAASRPGAPRPAADAEPACRSRSPPRRPAPYTSGSRRARRCGG